MKIISFPPAKNVQQIELPEQSPKKHSNKLFNRFIAAVKRLFASRIALLFIAIFLISEYSHAQSTQYEEVVYLKNGSVIRGVILEQTPNVSIKIATRDSNLFVFKIDEIEKITKELPKNPNSQQLNITHHPKKEKVNKSENKYSYELITEIGYLIGVGEITIDNQLTENYFNSTGSKLLNEDQGLSLKTTHAFKMNDYLLLGFGVGFDFLQSLILMPISADGRLMLGKGKIKPYVDLGLGHGIAVNGNEGGFMFKAGFGINTASKWAFNMGLRTQKTEWGFLLNGQQQRVSGTGKFLTLTTGYYF